MKKFIPFAALLLLVALTLTARAAPGDTTILSLSTTGGEAVGYTHLSGTNLDGRYVAFVSHANNLVPGADPYEYLGNVFFLDRQTGITEQIDLTPTGEPGGCCAVELWWNRPKVTDDGRYVTFVSWGNDLVVGDANNRDDVFVRDRLTGTTTLVSVGPDGSQGDLWSSDPSISADGRYIAFASAAENWLPGRDGWNKHEIYVRDTVAGTTRHVSVDSNGNACQEWLYCNHHRQPAISADGRYVAFQTATRLAPGHDSHSAIYVHDLLLSQTSLVFASDYGDSFMAAISGDGRFVAFHSFAPDAVPGDTNGRDDVFVVDRLNGTITRASVSTAGDEGDNTSERAVISRDGRYVTFTSTATTLVPGDINGRRDVFVRDMVAGITTRASVTSAGGEADYDSDNPGMSGDGCYVFFSSFSQLFAPEIENQAVGNYDDLFMHERTCAPAPQLPTVTPDGGELITSDFTITFPPGAVVENVVLFHTSLATAPHPLPAGQVGLRSWALEGKAVDGREVNNFLAPYTLLIPYSDAMLTSHGLDAGDLNVAYWNGSAWANMLPCAGCGVDQVNKHVTVIADHFTDFMLSGGSGNSANQHHVYLPLVIR